ncbi:MAG: hypothetical protein E7635_03290 [Ruminococcaceae bacterium]|nr:hypothetical protein [Oscillospiraceae bacterium]
MLEYIFKAILITSLIGTVLAIFITIIKPITRKYFSSRWHYYVWIVVLIAMIFPIRFPEPICTQPNDDIAFYSPIQEHSQNGMLDTSTDVPEPSSKILNNLKLFAKDHIKTFALIWILGFALLFLSKVLSYGFFVLRLRTCSDIISCSELKRFTDGKIITRVSDKFSSPLMVGIFRPTLLLPNTTMSEEQFNNVLSHELTHYRRKDIIYKWFVCLVKCIHWFNPIVYYISKQVNIECEISCDAEVVRDMTEEQQTRYIDTIITLIAAGNRKRTIITTGMVSDKKTLKRRFMMIKNKKRISKIAVVISVVFVIAVICATIFASGALNGKFIDEVVQSDVKDSKLEEIKTETGKIIYDNNTGDVVSVVSDPNLVTGEESEKIVNADEDIENPIDGEISMTFGKFENPITKEIYQHNGIDIKAPEGTDVMSSITGTVTEVGYDNEKGNYIVVECGNVKTLYAQLATTNVKKGDEVTVKQSIGTVGMTGTATGAHLHFEIIIDGEYRDPQFLMR